MWLSGKDYTCNAGDSRDAALVLGSGRSPGGGNGNPLEDSCLEKPMDSGAESQTQVSTHAHVYSEVTVSKDMLSF